jgi:hypothetical protein
MILLDFLTAQNVPWVYCASFSTKTYPLNKPSLLDKCDWHWQRSRLTCHIMLLMPLWFDVCACRVFYTPYFTLCFIVWPGQWTFQMLISFLICPMVYGPYGPKYMYDNMEIATYYFTWLFFHIFSIRQLRNDLLYCLCDTNYFICVLIDYSEDNF